MWTICALSVSSSKSQNSKELYYQLYFSFTHNADSLQSDAEPSVWLNVSRVRGTRRAYLHTVPVEPARMAGRTFEDGVGQDGLDGVQTDGAGLRQTEVWTHTQRLSGTVIWTERPAHKDKGSHYRAKSGFWTKKTPQLYSYFSIANIKVGSLYVITEWVSLLSANSSAHEWRRRQFYFQRSVLRFPHRRKMN